MNKAAAKIRVLVVEDSATVRQYLAEVIGRSSDMEVVGLAEDGKRGIELCHDLRPDVMTLDMVMPTMSGLAATEYIMAYCPTPIVIVSSSANRGETFRTWEALAAGAVEVLEKPRGDAGDDEWERNLIFTLRVASRVKVITHPKGRLQPMRPAPPPGHDGMTPLRVVAMSDNRPVVLAIGASTGGPGALVQILRGLDGKAPLPILLVIHIGELFGASFADWLDGQSALTVRWAVDGEPLPLPGTSALLMAPPDRHLILDKGRLRLTREPPRHSCRPSVDVLFESLASELGPRVGACLLTGMGKDGAEGLLAIRRAGGMTIAQDEATSIVFGMPREAVALGAAAQVLPIDQIAPALLHLSRGGGR